MSKDHVEKDEVKIMGRGQPQIKRMTSFPLKCYGGKGLGNWGKEGGKTVMGIDTTCILASQKVLRRAYNNQVHGKEVGSGQSSKGHSINS